MRNGRPEAEGFQPPPERIPLESRESERLAANTPWALWALPLGLTGAILGLAHLDLWRGWWVGWVASVLLGLAALLTVTALVERWQRFVVRSAAAPGWLQLDDDLIARVRGGQRGDRSERPEAKGRTALARWSEPFGVSVLANTARTRALVVFTTPSATRFLGLRLGSSRDADLARSVLDRAVTVPDADLELAVGPTPDMLLGAVPASALFAAILRRQPEALQRLYTSDARGQPIVVEGESLVVGASAFDLTLPVEWRVFTFHEGEAGLPTLYQATSIRQGSEEVVLVCRAPEELASWTGGRSSDAPPAREVRIAIDRLFMTPLRSILERAPRFSRPGSPSRDKERTVET